MIRLGNTGLAVFAQCCAVSSRKTLAGIDLGPIFHTWDKRDISGSLWGQQGAASKFRAVPKTPGQPITFSLPFPSLPQTLLPPCANPAYVGSCQCPVLPYSTVVPFLSRVKNCSGNELNLPLGSWQRWNAAYKINWSQSHLLETIAGNMIAYRWCISLTACNADVCLGIKLQGSVKRSANSDEIHMMQNKGWWISLDNSFPAESDGGWGHVCWPK